MAARTARSSRLRSLIENGHAAVGFDRFNERFSDPRALEARYDAVFSQDVIEHDDAPRSPLRRFDELVRPGGLVAIGTPNAEHVDLGAPELHVQLLNPYHRHIMSKRLLFGLHEFVDWQLVHAYTTGFTNTIIPGLNTRFLLHYARMNGDDMDLLVEPPRTEDGFWSPRSIWLAWFGAFFAPDRDLMAIYRASGHNARRGYGQEEESRAS